MLSLFQSQQSVHRSIKSKQYSKQARTDISSNTLHATSAKPPLGLKWKLFRYRDAATHTVMKFQTPASTTKDGVVAICPAHQTVDDVEVTRAKPTRFRLTSTSTHGGARPRGLIRAPRARRRATSTCFLDGARRHNLACV